MPQTFRPPCLSLSTRNCRGHIFSLVLTLKNIIYICNEPITGKFVSELMKIGVKLDVFDCQSFDPQPWLGHTQMWWDQLANDLSSLQISLRMITKADPDFSTYYARRGMEAHFQFRKFGDGDILAPLRPI